MNRSTSGGSDPVKYVSSSLGPFLVGGVLLVAVVAFSTLITDPSAAEGKAAFFPLVLVALPAIPITIGLFMVGPRRRYVAATTPEERRMHKAEARRTRRVETIERQTT
jgi:hypothetical protein